MVVGVSFVVVSIFLLSKWRWRHMVHHLTLLPSTTMCDGPLLHLYNSLRHCCHRNPEKIWVLPVVASWASLPNTVLFTSIWVIQCNLLHMFQQLLGQCASICISLIQIHICIYQYVAYVEHGVSACIRREFIVINSLSLD